MTVRQQWMAVAGVVLVLGVVLGLAGFGLYDQVFPLDSGSRAPQLSARAIPSGERKTLADFRGHVVLLNVWATWCAPCKAEMPDIEKLYREFEPRGLKVLAVSVDTTISDSSVLQFARGLGLTFDILRDSTHAIERDFQVTGYPETFVIDDVGIIRQKRIGAYAWDSRPARALVASLLGLDATALTQDSVGGSRGSGGPPVPHNPR